MSGPMKTDVALADLPVGARVADGGHGTVFRLPGTLLKLYHPGTAVLPRELGRLVDLPGSRDELRGAPVAWPSGRVFDRGRCVGLLLPEAPTRFTTAMAGRSRLLELQFLLYPRRAMWADLVLPTPEERCALAAAFVGLFVVLHRNDVVVGDVSMRNLLWTLEGGPAVFAVDCDGYRLGGRPPGVRPVDTAGWTDPAPHGGGATLDTDRYKLALVILRVLLGEHAVTPEDVRVTPALRHVLGPAVGGLAARAAVPGTRPAAADWLTALEVAP